MIEGGLKFHIDYHDYTLQVYVVGYRTMGESILVLFKEQEKTFFSIVIDSFCIGDEPNTFNRTIDILNANGVKKLSMLVMTHPHEDHILGMEKLIDDYCDGDTKFYYPTHSFCIDNGLVILKEQEKIILSLVRQKNDKRDTFSNQIGVPVGQFVMLEKVYLYDNDDSEEERPIPVEIVALTPITSVNDAKRGNKRLDPNDLSISVLINIQEYYLLFGADTTNSHILKFNQNAMSAVKFVKIPHHASDSASKLIRYFGSEQLDYACCTSFYQGNSNLPDKTTLDLYKSVARRIDVIGCPTNDTRPGDYGDICYQFKPSSRIMQTEVSVNGITTQIK